jgi:hypothetical protein
MRKMGALIADRPEKPLALAPLFRSIQYIHIELSLCQSLRSLDGAIALQFASQKR